MPLTFNEKNWDTMLKGIVRADLVPRAEAVAEACNEQMREAGIGETDPDPGYRVSIEGEKPLQKHDYRATVITATYPAMYDNAVNNRLVINLHRAEGHA